MNILKFSVPEIFFGRGSMKYAASCARILGAEKVFFVSDTGLEHAGWVENVFEILEQEKLKWCYYNNVVPNPRDSQIHEGAVLYKEQDCDVVMALGGGSPMDTAKGIALIASNGGTIRDYEGANRIQRPLPPMVFIPSSAGSGADISQFAIINDMERRVKMSIISRTLVPNISVIDPILLTTKSENLIISAAIDALCHAIESYVSVLAFPFSEPHALKAIDLIIRYLPKALETRSLDTLEQLSVASTAAAMSFSNAGLGLVHALAHSLGGMLDTPHGLIHPVLLPHVMRYNLPACEAKLAHIGLIILEKSLKTDNMTALAGIEKLKEFCYSLNVAIHLRDIVPDKASLTRICQMAMFDACLLTNPRSVNLEEMLEICEAAW